MPSAESLNTEVRFVAMFIGPSKSGKTVAAASFRSSEDKKIYIFDFDGRVRGLLGAPWLSRKGIEYDTYPPKMNELYEAVNKKLELWDTYAQAGQRQNIPETVILDSITSESNAMLRQAVDYTHVSAKQAGKDKKQSGRFIGNFPMPDPGDYGYQDQVTKAIIDSLLSLPIPNVIVTGHVVPLFVKEKPDDPYSQTIARGERLSITDKLGSNIATKFDHCFRFDKKEVAFGKVAHTVRFRDAALANTSYASLPDGDIDWTGKNFYNEVFLPAVRKEQSAAK